MLVLVGTVLCIMGEMQLVDVTKCHVASHDILWQFFLMISLIKFVGTLGYTKCMQSPKRRLVEPCLGTPAIENQKRWYSWATEHYIFKTYFWQLAQPPHSGLHGMVNDTGCPHKQFCPNCVCKLAIRSISFLSVA